MLKALYNNSSRKVLFQAPPTSKKFIESLVPFKLKKSDCIRLLITCSSSNNNSTTTPSTNSNDSKKDNEEKEVGINKIISATIADFGPNVIDLHLKENHTSQQHLTAPLIIADPITGITEFKNVKESKGSIVLMKRGDIPFTKKVQMAQAAGAVAVIVIQTGSGWPYTMTDQNKQSKDLVIPCVMVSSQDGVYLQTFINKKNESKSKSEVRFITQENKLACPICQDDFDIGDEAVKLPCAHYYHHPCLVTWLKQRNTCPLCRFELPLEPGAQLPPQRPVPVVRPNHTLDIMIS